MEFTCKLTRELLMWDTAVIQLPIYNWPPLEEFYMCRASNIITNYVALEKLYFINLSFIIYKMNNIISHLQEFKRQKLFAKSEYMSVSMEASIPMCLCMEVGVYACVYGCIFVAKSLVG